MLIGAASIVVVSGCAATFGRPKNTVALASGANAQAALAQGMQAFEARQFFRAQASQHRQAWTSVLADETKETLLDE